MKKLLFKLSAAAIALLFTVQIMAQKKEADLLYLGNDAIIIDGVADDIWDVVHENQIDVIFQVETPTLTSATWKAVWNDDGVYVLVEVTDDVWSPSWISGLADWQSDKVELYIDTSDPLEDGLGASNGVPNLQVAPNFTETDPGTAITEDNGVVHADTYDGTGV